MINHFQTLLINQPDLGDRSEGIPAGFVPFTYNRALSQFHNLIIPERQSRFFKKLISYVYLRYIDAAGMSDDTKILDPRITYDLSLDKSEFFQFNRISNPKLTVPVTPKLNDPLISVIIHGKYSRSAQFDEFYEKIRITQIGASNVIKVESLNSNGLVTNVYVPSATLIWSGPSNTGNSNLVIVGSSGLSVSLATNNNFATSDSNNSSDRQWEFIVEAPIKFSINDLMDKLNYSSDVVSAMLALPAKIDSTKYDNLWKMHYNRIYKLAGLIIAFALRADNPNNRT